MNNSDKVESHWYSTISMHLTAVGTVTGFILAALSAVLGLSKGTVFTATDQVMVTTLIIALVVQIFLWVDQMKRNRQIAFLLFRQTVAESKIKPDTSVESYEFRNYLKLYQEVSNEQFQNTKRGDLLDTLVSVTTFLVLLLVLFRFWGL